MSLGALTAALLLALSPADAPAPASAPTAAAPSATAQEHPRSALCVPAVVVEGAGVPADIADDFAAVARHELTDLRQWLGDESCAPISITLIPSMSDAPSLSPSWRLPSWAAGAAQPAERRIVVGVTAEGRVQDRDRTLRHELAHVVARSAAGSSMPRWLDEGIARVAAGEHGIDDLRILAHARLADRFLPLAALEQGFPPGAADAALAYAEAGRAVSLLQEGHPERIAVLLSALQQGESIDSALRQAGGRATWQLDRDIKASVGLWAAFATVGIETDAAMALCALVVAWFGVRMRRRMLQRMAAMDDDGEPRRRPATASLVRWTVAAAAC